MQKTGVLNCVPVLQVTNARTSSAFYCNVLGFTQDWEHQFEPGFPLFISVSCGATTLFLTEHPESAVGALVYIYVEDIDALANRVKANGVALDLEPVDQPWGLREMHLKDVDGNCLRFGQSLS